MSVSLKSNFFKNARGITLTDGGGATWSFNSNTNALSVSVAGGAGIGTVTSVGLASTDFTVSGSPVTTAGTITANLVAQAGVVAASYTYASLTVNSKGVITAVSNGVQPVTSVTSTADTTATSNALTADAQLTLTFNETGKYAIEIFLPFYEAAVGTGGFQFDLNSGSATVGGIVFGVDGFVTGAVANAAITSVSTATTAATIATSASAPSWFLAKGWMSITVAGTVAVRWAQNTTLLADPTTLKAGAYFMATKIG